MKKAQNHCSMSLNTTHELGRQVQEFPCLQSRMCAGCSKCVPCMKANFRRAVHVTHCSEDLSWATVTGLQVSVIRWISSLPKVVSNVAYLTMCPSPLGSLGASDLWLTSRKKWNYFFCAKPISRIIVFLSIVSFPPTQLIFFTVCKLLSI